MIIDPNSKLADDLRSKLSVADIRLLVKELSDLAGVSACTLTAAQLAALRNHLGIPVKAAIEFIDETKSKRAWYYYEEGRNPVPPDVTSKMMLLLRLRNATLRSFIEGDYKVGQYRTLEEFKASLESATDVRWYIHQSAEAEFVAKLLSNELVDPEASPCRATALYYDGRNNFQTNYAGTLDQIKANFVDEMERREAVWATLHREADGALISNFFKNK